MRKLIYAWILLGTGSLFAQDISPQVLNAAGAFHTFGASSSGNASVTDNVGELFTESLGSGTYPPLTQGFIQPEIVPSMDFTITLVKNDVSCSDKDDGMITTALLTKGVGYEVTYAWTPTVVCPGGKCDMIDSLRAGTYGLQVTLTYTTLAQKVIVSDTLFPAQFVTDVNGPCKVKVYTGVNLNSNGHLFIENILQYPNNHITIFNRWGTELYNQEGYDNSTKFWPATEDENKLLASTYFYVLDLGDGSKPIKGWIELLKN